MRIPAGDAHTASLVQDMAGQGYTPTEIRVVERACRILRKRALGKDNTSLAAPAAVKDYLRVRLACLSYEAFHAVWLDSQLRVIEAEEVFRGTLTQTSVYPREMVKRALRHNAGSVILAHNHPSGVAEPSIQDQTLTRTLGDTLGTVDVKVVDHIIVAGAATLSFAERGLI